MAIFSSIVVCRQFLARFKTAHQRISLFMRIPPLSCPFRFLILLLFGEKSIKALQRNEYSMMLYERVEHWREKRIKFASISIHFLSELIEFSVDFSNRVKAQPER
jgi:hypothetical protein